MTRDGHRTRGLVDETGGHTRDAEDVRRMSHNPEVAGSNPAPATRGYRQNCRFHTDRTVAVACF
jgi:hypothetical protein